MGNHHSRHRNHRHQAGSKQDCASSVTVRGEPGVPLSHRALTGPAGRAPVGSPLHRHSLYGHTLLPIHSARIAPFLCATSLAKGLHILIIGLALGGSWGCPQAARVRVLCGSGASPNTGTSGDGTCAVHRILPQGSALLCSLNRRGMLLLCLVHQCLCC